MGNEPRHRVETSKFLSYVLRHRPDSIGLVLEDGGWVAIERLLEAANAHGRPLDRALLLEVVETNEKKRFAIEVATDRIRASQGHSIDVDLGYEPAEPPAVLYHGTVERFLPGIRVEGLRPMERHHVHLSKDEATAKSVGARRGKPVVLVVDSARMRADGHVFFVSANGVWLVERVPPGYLREP